MFALLFVQDLGAVRMLCEKTKEVAELACAKAVEGEVVALAALLLFDADKINESVIEFRDTDSGPKEKLTIYEHVVRKVLTLGSATTVLTSAKPSCISDSENTEKRKILISEIELLQHFGAVVQSCCTDKKVTSPFIRAVQVILKSSLFLLWSIMQSLVQSFNCNFYRLEINPSLNCF